MPHLPDSGSGARGVYCRDDVQRAELAVSAPRAPPRPPRPGLPSAGMAWPADLNPSARRPRPARGAGRSAASGI